MSWTIKDLLAIPLAEVIIEQPLEGTVKVALGIKTHEKYGDSQFLVIEDGTGEIAIDYHAASNKIPLEPIEKGERVRIQAQEYKGKLSGAKKEVYAGKGGEKKAKITVYGSRLTNLSRTPASSAPAAQGGSVNAPGTLPLMPTGPRLTKEEAMVLWERTYTRALNFCAEPEAARCASTLLSGALAGMLATAQAPASATRSTTSPQQADDDDVPPYDDSDIPFSVLLPFLLPALLHFFFFGGFA